MESTEGAAVGSWKYIDLNVDRPQCIDVYEPIGYSCVFSVDYS